MREAEDAAGDQTWNKKRSVEPREDRNKKSALKLIGTAQEVEES